MYNLIYVVLCVVGSTDILCVLQWVFLMFSLFSARRGGWWVILSSKGTDRAGGVAYRVLEFVVVNLG